MTDERRAKPDTSASYVRPSTLSGTGTTHGLDATLARIEESIALPVIKTSDLVHLPERPYEYGDEMDGFRQCWMPGAFGDRRGIGHVQTFRVIQDEWREDEDGTFRRTILKAEVVGEVR